MGIAARMETNVTMEMMLFFFALFKNSVAFSGSVVISACGSEDNITFRNKVLIRKILREYIMKLIPLASNNIVYNLVL